jgi:hypothetical protein
MKITITTDIALLTNIWSSEWAEQHAGKTYEATLDKSGWAEVDGAKFPPEAYSMTGQKLADPKIRVVNNVGQIRTRSFPPENGVTTAKTAYQEGAQAVAEMFRNAIATGNLRAVMDLAKATETTTFYEY